MSRVESASSTREWPGTLLSLVQLTKPAVTRLVVITMACGAVVAKETLTFELAAWSLVGTVCVVGAANALNMYLERDSDGAMERTRLRPLPSGRLAPETALWFGVANAVAGLAVLSFQVNALTGLLAAVALLSYVLVYTPLKRVSPLALHVGAVPGAIPPVMGYTAVSGRIDLMAVCLFAILYVWQLPHFCAIALFRESEYARAGVRVMPLVHGHPATLRAIARYLVVMFAVSLAPGFLGFAPLGYMIFAALLSSIFLAWGLYGWRARSERRWARSLFFASMPYLVLLLGALVLSSWG